MMRSSNIGRLVPITIVMATMLWFFADSASAMLHPQQGQFMQRDPLGYVDGMGLYEYVRSGPVTHGDPSGRQCTRRPEQYWIGPRGPFVRWVTVCEPEEILSITVRRFRAGMGHQYIHIDTRIGRTLTLEDWWTYVIYGNIGFYGDGAFSGGYWADESTQRTFPSPDDPYWYYEWSVVKKKTGRLPNGKCCKDASEHDIVQAIEAQIFDAANRFRRPGGFNILFNNCRVVSERILDRACARVGRIRHVPPGGHDSPGGRSLEDARMVPRGSTEYLY